MIDLNLQKVLDIGVSLSAEKDRDRLPGIITTQVMEITNADGGILYVLDGDLLRIKVFNDNVSGTYLGGNGEDVGILPIPLNNKDICTHCAKKRKNVNIQDIYSCESFDFSRIKSMDKANGHRTASVLAVPFADAMGDVIGVLQLIGARDENDNEVPFSEDAEAIVTAIASQAGIAITNAMYLSDIKGLFESFVQVMITAIDEMSPYNVNHTRKITEYAGRFVDYLNRLHEQGRFAESFDSSRREQLIMGAWMHDIGKLITPLEVMNKSTRLSDRLPGVMMKIEMAMAMERIQMLEGRIPHDVYRGKIVELRDCKNFITELNTALFVDEQSIERLGELKKLSFISPEGELVHVIDEYEYKSLCVPTGTLTEEERAIMQGHVKLTAKLLSKISFGKAMGDVPQIAARHHEFLDGTGYPEGLTGKDLSTEVRILSILDIFEALTATDRPYKKTMPDSQALDILKGMAKAGKLDSELVELFEECMQN